MGIIEVFEVVPAGGLEPPRLAAPDFESGVSTDFTTQAHLWDGSIVFLILKLCKISVYKV